VKVAWYGDVHFEQLVVTEFLVAEKESVTNIYQQLKNVYGISAIDKSTCSHWASEVAGSEKGQVELSDACCSSHLGIAQVCW
jgi:hypothetical protein